MIMPQINLNRTVSLMKHMFQISNNAEMEILLVLLRGKTHLREISRTINLSPATVLRKLSELADNGIVDYVKEGKNNVYSIKNNLMAKQAVYRAENYKLTKLLKKYPELSIILEDVSRKIKDEVVILFGSYAKFSANKESDIDIYVETKDNSLRKDLKSINSKINGKIGEFDIDSLLIKEIIKNHVILRGAEKFYDKTKFFE
ncbi:MAG: nucleotidyltransferase domain-containing protein [archaeon]